MGCPGCDWDAQKHADNCHKHRIRFEDACCVFDDPDDLEDFEDREDDEDRWIMQERCPWHGWEFDIRTGQSWFDPKRVRVRSYDVTLEPVESCAAGALDPSGEREKGPYVAETYPVTVERQHVVVEVRD